MTYRFAILKHTMPNSHQRAGTHWDLLLELPDPDAALLTFAFPQPLTNSTEATVERLPDHRRVYLDYEGPISGDRGEVERWDGGQYEGGWLVPEQHWRAELRGATSRLVVDIRLQPDGRWQAVAEAADALRE